MFFKMGVFKNFVIFRKKHLCWGLFLTKFQAWRPSTSLKRNSNTGLFLWILRNFEEQLFYRTPPVAASKEELLNSSSRICILMNFSNLLLWEGYLSLVMHHEQCNFIILAVREENKFQQNSFLQLDLNSLLLQTR